MGQYYKAVFLNNKNKVIASSSSSSFSDEFGGLKLMEHSWMENHFVRFIEGLLMVEPSKIVWAGDYADKEDPKTLTDKEIKRHVDNKHPECWSFEVLKRDGINLYTLAKARPILTINDKDKDIAPLNAKYLINHDKKQFVDKSKTPKDSDGWQIHPLPLLTCEGNGRGGGDYHGESELIGIWARDLISVSTRKSDIPKDYSEIKFNLVE